MKRFAAPFAAALVVLAFDPVAYDFDASKAILLVAAASAAAMLGGAGGGGRAALSAAILAFAGSRIAMALRAPGQSLAPAAPLLAAALLGLVATPREALRDAARRTFGPLGALFSLIVLAQWASGARQAHGTLANANFAGAGIAMLLPWAIPSRGGRRSLRLGLLATLLAFAALAATRSRGGAFAAAAALAWILGREFPRLRWPLLLGLPAAVLAAALFLGESNTVKVRIHYARTALALGLERPLLGFGLGGFQREYPPRRPLEEHQISGGRIVHAVHDDYLESFAEGGALGLGAHLFLLAAAFFAARRHPAPMGTILAFAAASLVDLPMRDPALLAILFVAIAAAAPEPRPPPRGLPGALLRWGPALALLALLPPLWRHARADREFARFLASGDAGRLDRALAADPDHRESLLSRSREEDLRRLVALEPHHADALYNLSRYLPDPLPHLRSILAEHDPHHLRTRCRLAFLLKEEDPLAAEALLAGAIEADPRPWFPWAQRAELRREAGRLDLAARDLAEAERRADTRETRRERLLLSLAGDDAAAAARAAARAETAELEALLAAAEARIGAAEAAEPAPRLEPEPGESPADFALRIDRAKAERRRSLAERTGRDHRQALLLASALLARDPAPDRCRAAARAARGLGDVAGAAEFEATALFLEALEALLVRDDPLASRKLERAFRASPALASSAAARGALRLFLDRNPKALDDAPRSRALLLPLLGR